MKHYLVLSMAILFIIFSGVYSHDFESPKAYTSPAIELSTTRTFADNNDKNGIGFTFGLRF